jgi:membrane protein
MKVAESLDVSVLGQPAASKELSMPDPDVEDGRAGDHDSALLDGDESPRPDSDLSPSSHPNIVRVVRAETAAKEIGARWRKRLDATWPGKVWSRLSALGFVDSSLQFSAAFILFFVPFLLLISAAIGRDLPRALVTRSGFSPTAAHDVTSLFAHGRSPITAFTVIGLLLTVAGADSMAKILQNWYGRVFVQTIVGWKRGARRAHWLVGAAGYLLLQFFIGRRVEPSVGEIPTAIVEFLLAIGFWWWSAHCLLASQVGWRRLFATGLATAICYTGVGVYVRVWASWAIVSNESSYGPIGAIMAILATLVALGIAIHIGAVIGCDYKELWRRESR